MRRIWATIAFVGGCGLPQPSFQSPVGTYTGEGKFTVSEGSMKVLATLELNSDMKYRLTLKPLGALGNEEGTWSHYGDALTLAPDTSVGSDLMKAMASAKRPKVWTLANGFEAVSLKDGPMNLELKRR
jgi:hypothetical protein